MTHTTTLEWRVEETCLNAWPALREVLLDGWILRISDGLTRRANSANPLRPVVSAPLRDCEALYRKHALPTIFRVPSLVDPSVDAQLAAAGYTREGDSCVLYGDIDNLAAALDPDVLLLPQATSQWFAAMAALQNHTIEQARTYRRIVGQIAIPSVFAALRIDGEIAALAYGAIHDALLCYESVITDGRRQRRGYARRIVASLAAWAKRHGARAACLEVDASNTPARALYDASGLKTELYRYHYRRKPPAVWP
ncbi:MAG: GNAT family N-acetyltransferase [Alphaproteobacteria bacterium]|nr:GNAT family N-acetyltransferase [Alphaproteobacteria bacterium]